MYNMVMGLRKKLLLNCWKRMVSNGIKIELVLLFNMELNK